MNSKTLAICDYESGYAKAFAACMGRKKELAFQVYVCDSLSQLHEVMEQTQLHFLFVTADIPLEERKKIRANKIFVFTCTGEENLLENEIEVFKYQSADKILEILYKHSDLKEQGGLFFQNATSQKNKILGVFSPTSKSACVTYGMSLAQKKRMEGKVLFVPTHSYMANSLFQKEEEKGNLSDVFYFMRQEEADVSVFLATVVSKEADYDFIYPFEMAEDIKGITGEEWRKFVQLILEKSFYEILILDLNEAIADLPELFALCHEIYIPPSSDCYHESLCQRFIEELSVIGIKEVKEKICMT